MTDPDHEMEEVLENMVCPHCQRKIEPEIPVFIRDGRIWHVSGSPHCVRCERCEGPCMKPRDHGN